jgi:hypothetical protein
LIRAGGFSEAGCLGEIDAETIAPALVFSGHFGVRVAELLLHIAFVGLGRGGEAGAWRMVGKFCFRSPSDRSPRTPAASAVRLTSRATSWSFRRSAPTRRSLKPIHIRKGKYFNNRIEQDHRRVKRRIRSMLGFKSMASAEIILTGIEMVHMMCKWQARFAYDPSSSIAGQFDILAA